MIRNILKRRASLIAIAGAACLMSVASITNAQRSSNLFRGNWVGQLTPDVLLGVPADAAERLGTPINFELRVFNRGRAELYFLTGIDEWDFTARETQITEIGENGVILARFPGAADNSQNAISINLTKVNDETLLIDWSLISTRSTLRFDGLDDIALAGAEQLTLSD